MNYWLLLIPLLTAFSGWITILVIRYSIFKPVSPVNILGFTLQGIFPKYKATIAHQLGRVAAAEFATLGTTGQTITDPKNFETIKPLIESQMDDFLRNRLKDQMPMISMFIGDKTIEQLKLIFIKEIEMLFPGVMHEFSGQLRNNIDMEKIITTKLAGISPEQAESFFAKNLDKFFQKAAVFAVIVGLLIGIIQLLVVI